MVCLMDSGHCRPAAGTFVLLLLLAGGCSSETKVETTTQTVVVTETVGKTAPRTRPKPRPKPQHFLAYAGPDFSLEVPSAWVLDEESADQGGFVRTRWVNPHRPQESVLVDVVRGETTDASTKAAEVSAATSGSSGYVELSSEPLTIAGLDGHRWEFRVDGDQRVDYFLNDCETGIAVLGSAERARFARLREVFERVADSVVVTCDAPPPEPELEPAAQCHSSYEPCLDPALGDYDCDGGEGDGPGFTGQVAVIGPDEYDLDRDGDGTGCD
jgi:hypothetical protein